ncbi:uncharacterized protein LOC132314259 [Cornus florida]|uniref:uncharacterized protein LOC132314259 n=1 Tax=Cornus florida TaxID=4283 RepID=UPI00289AC1DB|nr:uncharacterized protein LOC132314259 [Cornus florida]
MKVKNKEGEEKDVGFYRPLHRATLKGEWEKAKEFLEKHQDAVSADITGEGDTVLMVAVRSEKRYHFVKYLLEFMTSANNLEVAKLLVAKDQHLPNIYYEDDFLPLHVAALLGYKNMVLYLMDVTGKDGDVGGYGPIFVGALSIRGLYDFSEARYMVGRSVIAATTFGIPEVVEEIVSIFPEAIYSKNEEGQNLFQIAILKRQRDEVENISFMCESKFEIGRKTLAMIFSETHEDLLKEGEKWLKDTANSCTIVTVLVVTIVFSAVITVPGGSDDKSGLPILSRDKAFVLESEKSKKDDKTLSVSEKEHTDMDVGTVDS